LPTWFPRALRLTIGYVLGTLALLWFLGQARDLVGLVLLAALFSLSLEPAVNRLHRRGCLAERRPPRCCSGHGVLPDPGLMVITIMVESIVQIADDVPGVDRRRQRVHPARV
jgi:predicted PurR-regulated permease PerM